LKLVLAGLGLDKFSANGKSFWSIDEGWDSTWFNRDGTVSIEGTGTHLWGP